MHPGRDAWPSVFRGKIQVMSAKPDFVVNTPLTRPAPGAATGGFVINLTSSTTPMALSQPKDPTLAQYTFFVSRRLEDGRERFRLHMGYFESQQAAEEMLAIVREIYPQAWAGEAPGKKLRPKESAAQPAPAPAAAAAPVARAPVKAPAPAPAPLAVGLSKTIPAPDSAPTRAAVAKPAPAPVHVPAVAPPMAKPKFEEPFLLTDDEPDFRVPDVPVVHPPAAAPVVSQPAAGVARPVAKPAPTPAAKAPAKPAAQVRPAAAKAAPKSPPMAQAKPVAKAAPARPAAPPVAAKPAVKATPAKPPLVAPKIAAKVSAPQLPPAAAKPAPVAQKPAPKAPEPTVMMPIVKPTVQQPTMTAAAAVNNVRQVIEELDDLSDTQTIRLLERHNPYKEGSQEASADEAIRVIKPEDAQSMAAIKNAITRNAPVLFAVQLDWSVAPFDMGKVPPLAIFNAYTLYTTEANREGRTWYGLRLGFFSDAVSAKQVAYYVRSDFKTVSVVPVTTIEKERATDRNAERSGIHRAASIKGTPAPTPASLTSSNASGIFQLLEDDTPAQIVQDIDGEMSPRFFKPAENPKPAPAAAAPAPASDASKKSRKPGPKGAARRDAHAQVDEETLDQTLEILGAHTLEITNDASNDTGVRHLRVKVDKKGSKFASLIDRLSGKK
jgi:hypothetical protein